MAEKTTEQMIRAKKFKKDEKKTILVQNYSINSLKKWSPMRKKHPRRRRRRRCRHRQKIPNFRTFSIRPFTTTHSRWNVCRTTTPPMASKVWFYSRNPQQQLESRYSSNVSNSHCVYFGGRSKDTSQESNIAKDWLYGQNSSAPKNLLGTDYTEIMIVWLCLEQLFFKSNQSYMWLTKMLRPVF